MFSGIRNYFSGRNYDHPDYASQQSWPTRHKVSNWLSGINKSSRHKDPYWNKGYEDDSRYYSNHHHHHREHVPSSYPHQSGSRMRQRHKSMPNMRAAPQHSLPPMKDERPHQSAMYGNRQQSMYPYQQRSHNEYSMIPQYHSKHYEPQNQYMNPHQYQSPLRKSYHGPASYNNNYNGNHLNRYSSIGGGGGGGYNQYIGQMNSYSHSQQGLQQHHHHHHHHHGYNTSHYQRQHYPSNYM